MNEVNHNFIVMCFGKNIKSGEFYSCLPGECLNINKMFFERIDYESDFNISDSIKYTINNLVPEYFSIIYF